MNRKMQSMILMITNNNNKMNNKNNNKIFRKNYSNSLILEVLENFLELRMLEKV